jgi:transcriptional regulator with XRE-family HTH domain
MKTYGEILKELREGKGLSQSELAKACSIPVASLQNHEQGRREINLADMFAYSQALGVECTVFKKGQPAGKDKRQARKSPSKRPRKG